MVEQRLDQFSPARVAPAAAVGQQAFQIVDHDQNGRTLLKQAFETWESLGPEFLRIVEQAHEDEIGELALQVEGEVGQGVGDVLAQIRRFGPGEAGEAAVFVAPGELQGAGGLAGSGHAVEEDAARIAVRRQGLARSQHGEETTHEALRRRREALHAGLREHEGGACARYREGKIRRARSEEDGRDEREGRGPGLFVGIEHLCQGGLERRGQRLAFASSIS